MQLIVFILTRAALFFFGAAVLLWVFGRYQVIVPFEHIRVVSRYLFTAFLVAWLLSATLSSKKGDGALISIKIGSAEEQIPSNTPKDDGKPR